MFFIWGFFISIRMKYVSLLLASLSIILCLVLLYFISTTELFSDRLQGGKRTLMIVILTVYSAFRIYKLIKTMKQFN